MTSDVIPPGARVDHPPKLGWIELSFIAAAVLLLVPYMTRAIVWAAAEGKLPIKPRDYTLLFLGACSFFIAVRRPSICLPALLLLGVPILRVADAAFLRRFDLSQLGDPNVLVLTALSNLLVSAVAVILLTTADGRRIATWVSACAVVAASLSIYYEWLGFASFTRIPGRLSGFAEDPNDGPILCCMMLGVLFTLNPRFWWNLALAALAAPAIILTLSRSGAAIFAVLMVAYLAANLRRHFTGLMIALALATPVLVGGMVMMVSKSAQSGMVKDENTDGRMRAILELDFDKIGSPERAKDLRDGWEAVKAEPLIGYGAGAGSSRWQPHNQVVSVWIDLGLLGMLAFAFPILLVTFKSAISGLRGIYCLIPVWLFIPCSQILIEMPHYFMAFAVAAQAAFPGRIAIRLHHPRTPLPYPDARQAGLPHS